MENRHRIVASSPVKPIFKARAFLEKTPGRKYQRKKDFISPRIETHHEQSDNKTYNNKKQNINIGKNEELSTSLLQLQESIKQNINDTLNEINHAALMKETRLKLQEAVNLEEKAKELENSEDPLSCLDVWEKRLNLLVDLYGKSDIKTEDACKKFILLCNSFSMNYRDTPDESIGILKRSLRYLEFGIEFDNIRKMKSMTLNNISFVFRIKNMFEEALEFAQRAFSIEIDLPVEENGVGLADSYLNIGAILSKLGKHKQSLAHANTALEILLSLQKNESIGISNKERSPLISHDALYSSIVVAHNNIAVELEHLMEISKAAMFHEKALTISINKLGSEHAVTKRMENVHERFINDFKDAQEIEKMLSQKNKQKQKPVKEQPSKEENPKIPPTSVANQKAVVPTLDLSVLNKPTPTRRRSQLESPPSHLSLPMESPILKSQNTSLGTSMVLHELNNILLS
ncbi:predicted protein [Naegleria gruberi]|uniref:Predicted protein n=1 Tax=Naegleria gruberi TaxID=5762 RepID=D2VLZ5_NAEGR|nr:uncharacterized protein NAEGRDRAFT_69955 [Naegleria gruberi]EFC42230.1 predicted protein [Naegleria gruberi]|eukprot:XP_002674974.1 predicted protein [Naegleria gruberi strain NEG-M]